MANPTDPAREAFTKMARILERLPSEDDKRRVIRAFTVLLDMPDPRKADG